MATKSRQRGVALITVLLVFALVAVLAAEMLRRSQLNLRSVANLIDTRQAYYYALAGEAYARQMLARHARGATHTDKLTDDWAKTKEQAPFEIEHGKMTVEIHDLQGRFNLNNVVDDNGQVVPDNVAQLQRLLSALGLNSRYAAEWQDWVDADQQRGANGAEEADYSGYRTLGRREADISALRLLHSMKPEDYAKLAPHVSVLPAATQINVNTADAAVLRALSPIISESGVAQILVRQQGAGYNDAATFAQSAGLTAGGQTPDVAVESSFFEVVVTVEYDNRWQRLRTVLRRDNNSGQATFAVISRARSPLIDDIEL
jgi:general secretion pathway protein K